MTHTIPVSNTTSPRGDVVMRVQDLTKTYGHGPTKVAAVRSVNLDIRAGELLLVMGPSGSGKTTLLLMLGALLRPSSGSVVVTGPGGVATDISAASERELPSVRAGTFGFVFQDYALLDALTAEENIAVAANIAGTTGRTARSRAESLLDRVGLTHRRSARPSQMSGGEQQRVAVARALANDPPVILADEPTANLDAARGRDLARLLRRLADEDARAVVVVSHDERLREVADRVLWLEDGIFKQLEALVVDPVCGMQVEPTGAHAEIDGEQWWFCSDACRRDFVERPAQRRAAT